MMKVWPGEPFPLGATWDGSGTNFSLFSEVAQRVELCLFDENGNETRVDLSEVTGFCWHGYIPNVKPGQRYGFRVHGPWDPEKGLRCNPNKLLLDPYGKAICGEAKSNEAVFPYHFSQGENSRNDMDSAQFMPRCVITDPSFDWGDDRPPRVTPHETIIYEVHVKGFTQRHPGIPENLRGKYEGLGHPEAIRHFKQLGITAVELLPVHQFIQDSTLHEKGLRNYWGYNSIGYFAPHNEYSASGDCGQQVQEFKRMVKALHQEGIEVILDVVYNHTAEGNHMGPVLSFKGIDNPAYYRLVPDQPRYYMDTTGTGNSLNMRHPHVLQLIMDSLRYWILDMHVDGFRFDLAATLARELHAVDRLSAFFDLIHQDPVISQVKLIAEPWDVGEGGYQVGNFPTRWSEWNGKYRDAVRDYWRGKNQTLAEFATRFLGSPDLYAMTGRRPYASVNFITAHDGFTLNDLVSYNEKHNEANKEDNRDGDSHNRSWNCGAEGPSDNPKIVALRNRQKRNFLTALILSQGIPMILGGDEIGRTQHGNNNAYCQDNEISWFDWGSVDEDLFKFVQHVIQFRRNHPVFRRRGWFHGRDEQGMRATDVRWFKPDANAMGDEDWQKGFAKSLGVLVVGKAMRLLDERGEPMIDDSFYVLFNAHHERMKFRMPACEGGSQWVREINTAELVPSKSDQHFRPGEELEVESRSLTVLRCVS